MPTLLKQSLENIRSAADRIDEADTRDERARLNQELKAQIQAALQPLQRLSTLTTTMEIQAGEIDQGLHDDDQHLKLNNEAQSRILAALEETAFLLGQDEWAKAHGFRDPAELPAAA